MREYSNEEQDSALKVLSDLVNENQKLKSEAKLMKQFALRMLAAKEVHKSENSIYFFDDGLIKYQEDFDTILDHFFFDFYPNSNANKVDGQYMSTLSARIKDGTPFPKTGSSKNLRDKVISVAKILES